MELLIAISVLVFGILAILQSFPLGMNIQKTAQMSTVAAELCQARMEEVIYLPYESAVPATFQEDYGFIPSFPSYRRETIISYYNPLNPGTIPAGDLGIKKVEITVFWRNSLGAGEKEIKIASLISQR